MQQQEDSIFSAKAQTLPGVGAAVDALRELAVGIASGIVDERGVSTATRGEIALDRSTAAL